MVKQTEASLFLEIAKAWSDPEAAREELGELGVTEAGRGPWHNFSDGRCDILYRHRSGKTFRLQSNYYLKDCFQEVISWAHDINGPPETGGCSVP